MLEKKHRSQEAPENINILAASGSTNLTILQTDECKKSDGLVQASNKSSIVAQNISQVQTTSCTAVLPPNNQVPDETVKLKTDRRKVTVEEVESLINSLEAIENKTKSEKTELLKLKRKRRNLKYYDCKKEQISLKKAELYQQEREQIE